ncbi:fibrinogen C domain-containing protein 1-like [Eriocheir sinensis]|uniref:fibrinogen C domain-containing protein 1-like n=1 Tax=Eriocheir sinensis TaxID=95602 RepID=UPI0021C92601|nr:fibrinogen C domain-containing protein 1-like [Eriocheir sinensis]
MVTDGGGWTVIQRRLPQKEQENFSRAWSSYKEGFGQLEGEMWLGLEAMHQLTHSGHYELRVDMVDYELGPKYAKYKEFRVGPQKDGYRLFIANYSGNAGDALSYFHSGRRFSTLDRDQDLARNKSCAQDKEGGWWFHACYSAHPNGRFPTILTRLTDGKEIRWWASREHVLVLTHFEMKIRQRRKDHDSVVVTPANKDDHESSLAESTEDMADDYLVQGDAARESEDKVFDYSGHEGRSDILPWGLQAIN